MVDSAGYKFYREKLNNAKLIIAPMVDQSELAWRLLSKKYGAQLCYTPMMHAGVFIRDSTYRKENFQTCPDDRPLIVQFCSDDPELFLNAAKLVENECDAVDLNLGCPQGIARRGHYGCYLQDEWDLIFNILKNAVQNLSIPVTAKLRVFEDVNKSVEYAKMIEKSGVALIAVHGRTREQKGAQTGLASWEHIKAIKNSVKIPVFANGNILHYQDVLECLKETGCDGVMIAEGSLYNPALFVAQYPPVWLMVKEYLYFTRLYETSLSAIRGHVYKICHKALERHIEYREKLAKLKTADDIINLMNELEVVCLKDQVDNDELIKYWQCQPYIRSLKNTVSEITEEPVNDLKTQIILQRQKRKADKSLRKQNASERLANLKQAKRIKYEKCVSCTSNPKCNTCENNACRVCCHRICSTEMKLCKPHGCIKAMN